MDFVLCKNYSFIRKINYSEKNCIQIQRLKLSKSKIYKKALAKIGKMNKIPQKTILKRATGKARQLLNPHNKKMCPKC